ncbi:MAG: hypothetical protein HRT86_17605 [Ilumatobacteraceae bacterium]|nr:hypothetical protein [Ilumatobacteraceae bacterium]
MVPVQRATLVEPSHRFVDHGHRLGAVQVLGRRRAAESSEQQRPPCLPRAGRRVPVVAFDGQERGVELGLVDVDPSRECLVVAVDHLDTHGVVQTVQLADSVEVAASHVGRDRLDLCVPEEWWEVHDHDRHCHVIESGVEHQANSVRQLRVAFETTRCRRSGPWLPTPCS